MKDDMMFHQVESNLEYKLQKLIAEQEQDIMSRMSFPGLHFRIERTVYKTEGGYRFRLKGIPIGICVRCKDRNVNTCVEEGAYFRVEKRLFCLGEQSACPAEEKSALERAKDEL